MYCNYCGKSIQDDANICAYCGTRVGAVIGRKRLVRPLVEEARHHEARMLRSLGAPEKQALRKLLEADGTRSC